MNIEKVLIVGAGTMGRGLAQVASGAGYTVALHDADPAVLRAALQSIQSQLEEGVSLGKISREIRDATVMRIHLETDLFRAAAGVDLIMEAIPENLDWKVELFAQLHSKSKPDALFASNTSSLSISEMAQRSGRADRFIGMHFFNPPHLMKLLEVVRGRQTSEATLETVLEIGRRMGKETIVVQDAPGFATSRLGLALGLEAMRMLEAGVASAADIDRAMELGYNHPIGPLRLTDVVGLDVRLSIAEYLYSKLNSEIFRPPEILLQKVREGKLGKKTGEGFYQW